MVYAFRQRHEEKGFGRISRNKPHMMKKMNRGDSVNVEILGEISNALGCTIDNIIEFIPEKKCNVRRKNK